MTNEEIQSVMNSTFGGLAIFCRDLELDENLISKYQLDQILMERGFTDVTHKVGGLAMNCRYLVASSKGKDLSMFSQNPEFGHIVIQSGAFFKVLDILKENGKTQILLLNIPKEGVPIFASSKINIEEQVIEKGMEIFKRTIASEPLQELQSKHWVERTSFPIGMSQDGDFFLNAEKKGTAQKELETKKEHRQEVPLKEIKNQYTKNIARNKTEIKAEKTKEKKKGFWNKLFGR